MVKNFSLRETPGKYRLLVLHSPGNREEFWYNSTFHKLDEFDPQSWQR